MLMNAVAAGPLAWCAVGDKFRQTSGFGKFFLETVPRKKVKCNIHCYYPVYTLR
jgi:hypothetical protein